MIHIRVGSSVFFCHKFFNNFQTLESKFQNLINHIIFENHQFLTGLS